MGEEQFYQPLTRWDKVTVIIYRAGIVLMTAVMVAGAIFLADSEGSEVTRGFETLLNILLVALHAVVGLSVFFIHLYVSSFHKFLKVLYLLAILSLAGLFYFGHGNPAAFMAGNPAGFLLLLPLSGCMGFVTAKEAFCFRLTEGYLLAILMPMYLMILSAGRISFNGANTFLLGIALLLLYFTARKTFMPIHYDVGDKSAYK